MGSTNHRADWFLAEIASIRTLVTSFPPVRPGLEDLRSAGVWLDGSNGRFESGSACRPTTAVWRLTLVSRNHRLLRQMGKKRLGAEEDLVAWNWKRFYIAQESRPGAPSEGP